MIIYTNNINILTHNITEKIQILKRNQKQLQKDKICEIIYLCYKFNFKKEGGRDI